MRITQGTFSFLPDLDDGQIAAQVSYALAQGWALSVEYARAPHPRDTYWEMFGRPQLGLRDPGPVLDEIARCRAAHPGAYVKVNAFDATRGWETVRLSFLVARPAAEPGFELSRREGPGRVVRYELRHRGGRD
jgi:ribulose-bisphosphate carboxylase small chain